MKTIRNWFLTVLILGVAGGGVYEWWSLDLRWRPHAITKNQAEIGKILQASGWVSPHTDGPKLYLIVYRDCLACVRYEQSEFPKLAAAGVDTRVIVVARPDVDGAPKSTSIERSTVAELWVNRSWPLFQKWMAAPVDAWNPTNIPTADGDVARSAVVEVGRDSLDRLKTLLGDSGLDATFPMLIWWTKTGAMMGCDCQDPRSYRFVSGDLIGR